MSVNPVGEREHHQPKHHPESPLKRLDSNIIKANDCAYKDKEDTNGNSNVWREMISSRAKARSDIITWLIPFVAFVTVAALVAAMAVLDNAGGIYILIMPLVLISKGGLAHLLGGLRCCWGIL